MLKKRNPNPPRPFILHRRLRKNLFMGARDVYTGWLGLFFAHADTQFYMKPNKKARPKNKINVCSCVWEIACVGRPFIFGEIFSPAKDLSLSFPIRSGGRRRRRRKVKVNLSSPLFPNGLMGEGGEEGAESNRFGGVNLRSRREPLFARFSK